MSKKILFNDNWLFDEFPLDTPLSHMASSVLNPVELPHDWMIYHVNDLYKNSIGFYKKTFRINPVSSSHYFLYFEGVYMDCHIYLNGKDVFEWKYGYSSFEADITDFLISGENTVCVTCNFQAPNSRWYSGAGIYRDVYLIEKEEVFFTSFGSYISTEERNGDFIVFSDFEISSFTDNPFVIRNRIIKSDDQTAIAEISEEKCFTGTSVVKHSVKVSSPILWNINNPFLYIYQSSLIVDGKIVDSYSCNLGFRTLRFDPNEGFFLNGSNVKINGACLHHDLGALGSSVNRVALKRQLSKMVEMGVNSIRTSHNMPAPVLMELCDSMGLLVYSECFDMWELNKTEFDYANFFPEWWARDVKNWVMRDCNHPSLIIWGIGNEIYDTHAGDGYKWTLLLRDAVRKLDYRHNAFTSIASNYVEWDNAQRCSNEVELSGYNYGKKLYDSHHIKYPNWCIFGSETASTVQSRGIYHFPYEACVSTYDDGQCSSLGNCTTNWGDESVDSVVAFHRDRDFVFGQYIWTGWDYIGEPTPYFSKNSFFGQIDTAGFPKDTFYHYQAEWTDYKTNPMVHLLPYWDFNEGQIIDVCAYSNAPFVELFLNESSLGRQEIDHVHGINLQGIWKVPYTPGEIKVHAYDYDGKVIATDSHHSFFESYAIVLKTSTDSILADGKDICFIEISCIDKNGFPVENARDRVSVSVSGAGRLVGLDNGDSTDYDEYKGTSRRLFSGKLLAMVQSTYETGLIKVTVSAIGLETGITEISAIPCPCEKSITFFSSNTVSTISEEVPVRKINLKRTGPSTLTKEYRDSTVEYELLPVNTTYTDVSFKALTKDGIEANFAQVETDGSKVLVHALGDGDFRLTAYANNGKNHPEVISELEFSATNLGTASLNPYKLIPGIEFSQASEGCSLSFLGGVFIPCKNGETAYVTYKNIDFNSFGSDEITIPIFSFKDELGIEILEGSNENGKCLYQGTYRAKSIYNTYQPNTFKLSRRISGTKDITLRFSIDDRISVHGFYFKELCKAYSEINATEYKNISGDSFTVKTDSICNIGNNVTIEFDNMNFINGVSSVRITGKSHKPISAVHIMFKSASSDVRQMIEIPKTDDFEQFEFSLSNIGKCDRVCFVFLPGSDFDLKSFRFY